MIEHKDNAVEIIKDNNGTSHPLNATYLNGKTDEEFVSMPILNAYIKKDLSILNQVSDTTDRSTLILPTYDINNKQLLNINAKTLVNNHIRTCSEVPSDLQIDDYIFLEIKE